MVVRNAGAAEDHELGHSGAGATEIVEESSNGILRKRHIRNQDGEVAVVVSILQFVVLQTVVGGPQDRHRVDLAGIGGVVDAQKVLPDVLREIDDQLIRTPIQHIRFGIGDRRDDIFRQRHERAVEGVSDGPTILLLLSAVLLPVYAFLHPVSDHGILVGVGVDDGVGRALDLSDLSGDLHLPQ